MNLYSPKEMTDLLERHNFFFKKNLGQNFLINEGVAEKIANTSKETLNKGKQSLAIEIGPGAGALTYQLSKKFDHVIAIEIDPHLIPILEESLAERNNVKILNCDALSFDFSSIAREYPDYEYALCSNLPYYITSEIIMRVLECSLPLTSLTVLIQKEAAARFSASPNTSDYGSITLAAQYYAKPERVFFVGPSNFIPRPKVDSAVLRLIPHKEKPLSVSDESLLFALIRAAFSARRKTLSNALSNALTHRYSKEQINLALAQANIDPTRRGETLSLDEFGKLTDKFKIIEEQ